MAIEEQDTKFENPDQGPTLESIGPIGETLNEIDPIGLHNVHSEISAETKNTDDKELKSSFNKLSVNNILQMEEVKIIKEDGTVINFNNNKDDNNNNEDNNNEDNNNKYNDNEYNNTAEMMLIKKDSTVIHFTNPNMVDVAASAENKEITERTRRSAQKLCLTETLSTNSNRWNQVRKDSPLSVSPQVCNHSDSELCAQEWITFEIDGEPTAPIPAGCKALNNEGERVCTLKTPEPPKPIHPKIKVTEKVCEQPGANECERKFLFVKFSDSSRECIRKVEAGCRRRGNES